jgi:hypothetical protein
MKMNKAGLIIVFLAVSNLITLCMLYSQKQKAAFLSSQTKESSEQQEKDSKLRTAYEGFFTVRQVLNAENPSEKSELERIKLAGDTEMHRWAMQICSEILELPEEDKTLKILRLLHNDPAATSRPYDYIIDFLSKTDAKYHTTWSARLKSKLKSHNKGLQ